MDNVKVCPGGLGETLGWVSGDSDRDFPYRICRDPGPLWKERHLEHNSFPRSVTRRAN